MGKTKNSPRKKKKKKKKKKKRSTTKKKKIQDDDPRPAFTPRTADQARNQAEINRWANAEADRLAILGTAQRKAERQVELLEDDLYNDRETARESADARADERQRAANRDLANPTAATTATVAPAGHAVLPTKPTPHPLNALPRTPADEVREKVTAQIRKALPKIAAAMAANQNENSSG